MRSQLSADIDDRSRAQTGLIQSPYLSAVAALPAIVAAALVIAPPAVAQDADGGRPAALVVTAPVLTGTISEEIVLVGTAAPVVDSLVASEIEGRVLKRSVENGDAVAAGAPLVVLDSSRLERDLATAKAGLEEVIARLERSQRQETRAQDLHDSEVLADRFLDDAVSDRKALMARRSQVETRIAYIEDDLARSTIRAPFAGVVTDIHTEVGEWLEQGDPVVRLVDLHTVEITLDVPERHYQYIKKGDAAPIAFDSLPSLELDGKVFAVVPRAETASRTFPVLVRAANPQQRVGAGMLARVRLVLSTASAALQVPKDAIVRRQDGGEVIYLVKGDTVAQVPVHIGRADGTSVEVTGDLQSGDMVVIRGNERLTSGQKVRIDGGGGRSQAGSQ